MNIEDESNVHIFPCDFERMKESETYATCYSLPVGSPDKGETIPLFTESQAKELANEQIMAERDSYHEMADKLAERIAEIEGLEIGEHSNCNCPWRNALQGVSAEPD